MDQMNLALRLGGVSAALVGLASWALEAAELKSRFQAGNGGWHLGALAVGNIDEDPELEIIIPFRNLNGEWRLEAYKPDGRRVSGFPFIGGSAAINVSPTLYDLTGDGREEILFTAGNRVVVLRGDGSVLWSHAVSHSNYVPDAGFMAVTHGFFWSETKEWQSHLPSTAVFSSEVSPPIVADITGDGRLEVVTAWKIDPDRTSSEQDYNPFITELFGFGQWGIIGETWSGGVIVQDALTGERNLTYHFHQLVESGLALGPSAHGSSLNVYVLNDSDSVAAFDMTQPHGFFGKGMLRGMFGKNQRMLSGSYRQGVDVYTADLDGDGQFEVLAPTTRHQPLWQPHETILDDDGAVLWRNWRTPSSFTNLHGWMNSACMIPLNPGHDNRMDVLTFTHSHEISFRYWNGIELADHPGWPKDFYPLLPSPPVVGDLDGDGSQEIVIATYHPGLQPSEGAIHVFRLDGSEKWRIPVDGGVKHIPALADVEGDGSIDLVFRSLPGVVSIYNFGAANPTEAAWSTHRGNMRRDGHFQRNLFPQGTPRITSREEGYKQTRFSWSLPGGEEPSAFLIFRSQSPDEPFSHLITFAPEVRNLTDHPLEFGRQYLYQVGAAYGERLVTSPPFPVLSLLNNNLASNSGFEQDDDSHWDKWFSGGIPWTDMRASKIEAQAGERSMEIIIDSQAPHGSISQYAHYGIPESYLRVHPGRLYSFGGFFKSGGLSGPSRHWWEWVSSRSGEFPEDRPFPPWPYYFTPHWQPGANPTEWTYANRAFIMPQHFPSVEIRHRFAAEKPIDGAIYIDNVFFRELPHPKSGQWETWIDLGSQWRFLTNSPPRDWFEPDFDDSNWQLGQAKFGAGWGPKNIKTQLPQRHSSYYFRRTFFLEGNRYQELLLSGTSTDSLDGRFYPMEVYLNGAHLVTSGIEAVDGAGNTMKYYDLTPFLDLVRPGTNTLAIKLNNGWNDDWDNIAFDVRLQAVPSDLPQALARFTKIQVEEDDSVSLRMAGLPGSIWRLESSDTPPPHPDWQLIRRVVFSATAEAVVSDAGQNNRPHPGTAQRRFYRLIPEWDLNTIKQ
jgi:hypothetical protein